MRTKRTVTVYNPVGMVMSTAVMWLTAGEAAKVVADARENGVRVEVADFEKRTYKFRITKVVEKIVEIEASSVEAAVDAAALLVEEGGDVRLI